jgi:oligopeptide transport system substrate-binding protein
VGVFPLLQDHSTMLRLLAIPLALLAVLALVWGWSGGEPDRPADFTFVNRGDIKTLDPNRMSWLQDIRIGLALWEGLYSLDPATLDPVPGTAERIDVSDDGTVYTFHLLPTARWSNGDPVTADDFVFAWRRMLEQPGDYTYLFFYIKGAKAYQEAFGRREPCDFATVGILAEDDRTLRVTLENPTPFFPDLCAFVSFFPLHERSMEPFRFRDEATGAVNYDGRFTRPPNLVGNGPYRLESWQFKGRLRLVANEHYWNAAAVKSRVIDQLTAEGQISFQMYDAGQVDWLSDVLPEIAANLREKGRPDLHVYPGFGTYFYSFNCLPQLPDGTPNPFADVRVRQALAMAIDKQPVVDHVTRMGEPVTANYIPPGVFAGYTSPPGLPHDRDRARQLLAEAGFPGGQGFPDIKLLFNTGAHHGEVAQIITRQWQEQLGIDVGLEGVEVKTFGQWLRSQQYAVARASWIGDYNDPSTFTDKYRSDSDNNDAKWVSKAYDELCDAAAREADVPRRLELLSRAEAILLQEAPIVPIYTYVNVTMSRDNVKGIALHPKNMQMFQAIQVTR